jgi:hypothetical protein
MKKGVLVCLNKIFTNEEYYLFSKPKRLLKLLTSNTNKISGIFSQNDVGVIIDIKNEDVRLFTNRRQSGWIKKIYIHEI